MKFIKQLFCNHSILIENNGRIYQDAFIVTTTIICNKCDKSFHEHPDAYINHTAHLIILEIMREHYVGKLRNEGLI